jgi:hypothetical protein
MKKDNYQRGMLLIGIIFLFDAILSTIKHPLEYSYILKYVEAVIFILLSTDLLRKRILWILAIIALVSSFVMYLFLKYLL